MIQLINSLNGFNKELDPWQKNPMTMDQGTQPPEDFTGDEWIIENDSYQLV